MDYFQLKKKRPERMNKKLQMATGIIGYINIILEKIHCQTYNKHSKILTITNITITITIIIGHVELFLKYDFYIIFMYKMLIGLQISSVRSTE